MSHGTRQWANAQFSKALAGGPDQGLKWLDEWGLMAVWGPDGFSVEFPVRTGLPEDGYPADIERGGA